MAEAAVSARASTFEAHAQAVTAAERILALAKSGVRAKQAAAASPDAMQHPLHGLAWLVTYVEALRQMLGWGREEFGTLVRDRLFPQEAARLF